MWLVKAAMARDNSVKEMVKATHLGNYVCGPVVTWQPRVEGIRFIKYAKCEFMFTTDIPRTTLGGMDLLPAVVQFHREHHDDLTPVHGPWTIAMQVFNMQRTPDGMGVRGDVKVTCRGIEIAAPN